MTGVARSRSTANEATQLEFDLFGTFQQTTKASPVAPGRKECGVPGCGSTRRVTAGYCNRHYQQLTKKGRIDPETVKAERPVDKGCSVPGCDAEHKAKGYCERHYNRWRKNPDPIAIMTEPEPYVIVARFCLRCGEDISRKAKSVTFCSHACANKYRSEVLERQTCAESSCEETVSAKGLCKKHYMRKYFADNGEVLIAKQRSRYERNRQKILDGKREYYLANRQRIRAKADEWREANRETHNARGRAYSARNKEIRRAKQTQYRLQNPHVWREWARENRNAVVLKSQRRRSYKMGNPDSIGLSRHDWERLLNRFEYRCAYCGVYTKAIQMDHVVPLSRGGRHAIGNVIPACASCNSSKKDKFLVEWRATGARLRWTPGVLPNGGR